MIGRLVKGIDLRHYGSGNVGASNIFASVSKFWVVPHSLFEILVKGASPICIGLLVMDMERSSMTLAGAGLLAIAGHNWMVFLKFTGGRGIAVASGALLALAPWELTIFVGLAMGGYLVFKSAGTWVFISLLLLPVWSWLFNEPESITWFCIGIIGLVSLKRLLSNWTPLPADMPWQRVLFNRLIKDRDTDRREDWVHRTPAGPK
jgi:glycerol-3-phosphate acyltransferase PlsY